MPSKLTLRVDDGVIASAKAYARDQGTSISRLVSQYLRSLILSKKEDYSLTPLVREISGILSPTPDPKLYRTSYRDHLRKKHQ